MRESWFTLESLTAALVRAAVENSQNKVIARITRAELIVVDDMGMLPSGQAAAEAFYRLVDATYERRSLAVTSNLHPAGFDSFMPKTLATAAVDRLLHHVIVPEGTSLRLAEAPLAGGRSLIVPEGTSLRLAEAPLAGGRSRCINRPPGRSAVREQADELTAYREIPMSLDA